MKGNDVYMILSLFSLILQYTRIVSKWLSRCTILLCHYLLPMVSSRKIPNRTTPKCHLSLSVHQLVMAWSRVSSSPSEAAELIRPHRELDTA